VAGRDHHDLRDARAGHAPLEGVRLLSAAAVKARHVLDAIKFEHTIFALPFAYLAMLLAARGWPGWWTVAWVTVAMAGARTCAMAANRVIDRAIDARNPRTANRHLPRGLLRAGELSALAAAGAALMFVAAWMLNPLCLALAPPALLFLVGYSYTKRFTWASHWILGFTDGVAVGGGWIAATGTLEAPALVLWFAVTVWIAGFDLIYACQDVDVDRAHGLHSVPARFGVATALRLARANHVLAAAALALGGRMTGLGPLYWVGWLGIVALLAYEHSLVSARDLSRVNVAFFNVNGYIAVIALGAVAAGLAW
jgi:4-hydroxybenzoate polyprenyltransferase